MRVLVYPHELAIDGSQINAIDLAAAVRELGHEAVAYAQDGPLREYVTEEKGLTSHRAHDLQYRPAPTPHRPAGERPRESTATATTGVCFADIRSSPAWVRPPDRGAPKAST